MWKMLDVPAPSTFWSQMCGMAMLGWGAGKWATVFTGSDEAVTTFSTFNLVPMGMTVLNAAGVRDPTGLVFLFGYLYIVFTGPKLPAAKTSWPYGYYFLCFSAFCITANGLFGLFATEAVFKSAGMSFPGRGVMTQFSIAALGWGAGKWTSVYNGDKAINIFCKVNLVAIGSGVLICFVAGQIVMGIQCLVFSIAYGYFGFIDPPKGLEDEEEEEEDEEDEPLC